MKSWVAGLSSAGRSGGRDKLTTLVFSEVDDPDRRALAVAILNRSEVSMVGYGVMEKVLSFQDMPTASRTRSEPYIVPQP